MTAPYPLIVTLLFPNFSFLLIRVRLTEHITCMFLVCRIEEGGIGERSVCPVNFCKLLVAVTT
jgi:hypothetical protein